MCVILCTFLTGVCCRCWTASLIFLYHSPLKWPWSAKEEYEFVVRGSTGSLHVSAAAYINKSPSVSTVRDTLCFRVILMLASPESPPSQPPLFFICDFEKGAVWEWFEAHCDLLGSWAPRVIGVSREDVNRSDGGNLIHKTISHSCRQKTRLSKVASWLLFFPVLFWSRL